MTKITVLTTDINVVSINNEDYICITDMLKAKDGDFFISDWLRNRNTLEYLGIWERLYNPGFNYGEFATIRNQSGLNSFKISVKEYVEKTHAIGIQAKAGRYGGTYAHKDIAFEFGMWISAEFKIYLVREFQRLKEQELAQLGWSAKRELSKINYRIHTDAIKPTPFIISLFPDSSQPVGQLQIFSEYTFQIFRCSGKCSDQFFPLYFQSSLLLAYLLRCLLSGHLDRKSTRLNSSH